MSATRHNGSDYAFDAVVVVGSLGAWDSFRTMVSSVSPSFPAALIFDLHRSDPQGVTEQMLRQRCGLPVQLALDGTVPRPGQVYLAPYDRQLTISDDRRFSVHEASDGVGHRFADTLLAFGGHRFRTSVNRDRPFRPAPRRRPRRARGQARRRSCLRSAPR